MVFVIVMTRWSLILFHSSVCCPSNPILSLGHRLFNYSLAQTHAPPTLLERRQPQLSSSLSMFVPALSWRSLHVALSRLTKTATRTDYITTTTSLVRHYSRLTETQIAVGWRGISLRDGCDDPRPRPALPLAAALDTRLKVAHPLSELRSLRLLRGVGVILDRSIPVSLRAAESHSSGVDAEEGISKPKLVPARERDVNGRIERRISDAAPMH